MADAHASIWIFYKKQLAGALSIFLVRSRKIAVLLRPRETGACTKRA